MAISCQTWFSCQHFRGFDIRDNCVKNNKPRPAETCRLMILVSDNKLFVDIRIEGFSLTTVTKPEWVGWNPRICSCYCYFVSFRNKVDIIVPYDDTPLWIYADTNKDDLKWPWMPDSLVCFARTERLTRCCAWLSELTICVTEWTWALNVNDKNVTNEL